MNQKLKQQTIFLTLIISVTIIIGIIFSNYFFLADLESNERGSFGDLFGLSNALFSGLAFAGIIVTILMQRNELRMQREDLELTREELKLNRKELQETKETFNLQRFENTFFKLLELQNTITTNLRYNHRKDTIVGREVFIKMKENFEIHLRNEFKEQTIRIKQLEELKSEFERFFLKYYDKEVSRHLSVYFRSLQSILEFLDKLQIPNYQESKMKEIKMQYAIIIQSQFSDFELYWIYYNGISERGKYVFKPLIEKYSLLKFHSNTLEVKYSDILHPSSEVKNPGPSSVEFINTYNKIAFGLG